jgi:predicted transcriptional regulator
MPVTKRKKKRKPVRYKTLTIKLTTRQKRSLERFAKSRKTTPVKLIKKAIRPLLENYANLEVSVNTEKVNQLQLFDKDAG